MRLFFVFYLILLVACTKDDNGSIDAGSIDAGSIDAGGFALCISLCEILGQCVGQPPFASCPSECVADFQDCSLAQLTDIETCNTDATEGAECTSTFDCLLAVTCYNNQPL